MQIWGKLKEEFWVRFREDRCHLPVKYFYHVRNICHGLVKVQCLIFYAAKKSQPRVIVIAEQFNIWAWGRKAISSKSYFQMQCVACLLFNHDFILVQIKICKRWDFAWKVDSIYLSWAAQQISRITAISHRLVCVSAEGQISNNPNHENLVLYKHSLCLIHISGTNMTSLFLCWEPWGCKYEIGWCEPADPLSYGLMWRCPIR